MKEITLRIVALYFHKKNICRQVTNKNGKIILRILFYSHGKSNSCGVVAVVYCGTEAFKMVTTHAVCDKNGQILILGIEFNDTNLLLIGFYSSN